MRIHVDVDDTVANLADAWVKCYNVLYDDNKVPDEVTSWEMEGFKADKDVLLSLIPNIDIRSIEEVDGALNGVNTLRGLGVEIKFSTALNNWNKAWWLRTHGFCESERDLIVCYDKGWLRGSFLIDDKPENVFDFASAGGFGILFRKSWNRGFSWRYDAENWDEVISTIRHLGDF